MAGGEMRFISVVVATVGLITVANAQSSPQWQYCTGLPGVNWDKQIKNCSELIDSEIQNPVSRSNMFIFRGNAYAAKKQLGRAVQDFDQAIRLNPDEDVTYFNRAGIYRAMRRYDLAIRDLDQAIKLNPDKADYYNNRGAVYDDKHEYAFAIADFNRAIELVPSHALATKNRKSAIKYVTQRSGTNSSLAQIQNWCEGRGDTSPQQQVMGCSVLLDSGRLDKLQIALVHGNRGVGNMQLNRMAESLSDFDIALKISPKIPLIRRQRALLFLKMRRYQEAIEDFDKAIELSPNFVLAYYDRAIAKTSIGDIDHAIEDYGAALLYDPKYAAALGNRAILYEMSGLLDRALEDASRALDLEPVAQRYVNRAGIYEKMKNLERALEDRSAAIKLDPTSMNYVFRNYLYNNMGRYDEAMLDASVAIEKDKGNANAWNARCWSKALKGVELMSAKRDCDQALKLKPDFADALDSRALVYLKLGSANEALKDYEAALLSDRYVAGGKVPITIAGHLYGRGVARRILGDELGSLADMVAAKTGKPDIADIFATYNLK